MEREWSIRGYEEGDKEGNYALGQCGRVSRTIIYVTNRLGLLDAYSFLREHLVGPQAAIVMYHRVGGPVYPWCLPSVMPQDFENQIRYLCSAYKVMALDEMARYILRGEPLPKKAVAVTLDDGYKDNYLYAYPILKKYSVPATIFLITGYINGGELFWWDKVKYIVQYTTLETLQLDELGIYSLRSTGDRLRAGSSIMVRLKEFSGEKRSILLEELARISRVDINPNLGKELILSWDEVREMSNNGIAFGAHTVTHTILTKLPLDKARREIIESKLHVEERLDQAVTAFCYPNGKSTDFNNDIKEIVKESGFTCAVTFVPTPATPGADLYELGRISLGWNLATAKLSLCGLYPDVKNVLSRVKEM